MDDQSVTIDIPQTPVQEVTPPVETPPVATKDSPPVETQQEAKIERNAKGQIVKGIAQDTNKNGTAGRPCEYCQDKERLQKIVDNYLKGIEESEKPAIPWVEELALLLDISDVTLVNWVNKKNDNDESEHPELVTKYGKLKSLQKLRLKQRAVMGRFNPHGALYLLNADHKVIQTTKEVLSSDTQEPLRIIITEEKPIEEQHG